MESLAGQAGARWCDWTGSACGLPSPYSGETLSGSPYNLEYYDPYPYGYGANTSGNHLVGGNGSLQIIATKSSHFSSLGYSWAAATISGTHKAMVIPAAGGYLQVHAKIPDCSQGAWPGIWMMAEAGGLPNFDIEFGYTEGGRHPGAPAFATAQGASPNVFEIDIGGADYTAVGTTSITINTSP